MMLISKQQGIFLKMRYISTIEGTLTELFKEKLIF